MHMICTMYASLYELHGLYADVPIAEWSSLTFSYQLNLCMSHGVLFILLHRVSKYRMIRIDNNLKYIAMKYCSCLTCAFILLYTSVNGVAAIIVDVLLPLTRCVIHSASLPLSSLINAFVCLLCWCLTAHRHRKVKIRSRYKTIAEGKFVIFTSSGKCALPSWWPPIEDEQSDE